MFTGIVKGIGKVRERLLRPGLSTFSIELPADQAEALETGASIAIDGVCLTLVRANGAVVDFDVMQETLSRTTLGGLQIGDEVNVERSAREGAEIGGHPISGHVDDLAEIVAVETPENNHVITFQVPPQWMKYIFPKGYLALNGTSLTVAAVERDSSRFTVWFIPETLRRTTFGRKAVGDKVNFEIERNTQVIVDTVRSYLEEHLGTLLPRLRSLLGEPGASKEELPLAAPALASKRRDD